jgi:hypothetical protein
VQAFFTTQYLEAHPEDATLVNTLQDLIASQIPLLDLCIQIHRQKAPSSLMPFQQRLEECFAEMQNHVESKYGKKVIAAHVIHSVRKVHQWCTDVFFSCYFVYLIVLYVSYCKANCIADFIFHRIVFQIEMKILVRCIFYITHTSYKESHLYGSCKLHLKFSIKYRYDGMV